MIVTCWWLKEGVALRPQYFKLYVPSRRVTTRGPRTFVVDSNTTIQGVHATFCGREGIIACECTSCSSNIKALKKVCNHHALVPVSLELSLTSLNERWNCGFDPSLWKFYIKSLLACRLLEHVLKVGCKFWDLLYAPLKLWENFRI